MKRVKKTRCVDCRFFRRHMGAPVKEKGVVLQPGNRYCMAGKKPRLFRPGDPKVYPPKWCSAQIFPPVLRIYTVRSGWGVFQEYKKKSCQQHRIPIDPSPHHYTPRLTGKAPVEAREFYQKLMECRREQCYVAQGTLEELLGVGVREDEIVEFDDGILPVFFYVDTGKYGWLVHQIQFHKEGVRDE